MTISYSALDMGSGTDYSATHLGPLWTLPAAPRRVLLVCCASQGNPGVSDITCNILDSVGSTVYSGVGNVIATTADTQLYSEVKALYESDIAANLTDGQDYRIQLTTPGASVVGGGVLLFDHADQQFSAVTAGTDAGGTAISTDITVTNNEGVIVDIWAGDGSGAADKATPTGETRSSPSLLYWTAIGNANLTTRTSVTVSNTAGTKSLGRSGDFHNRDALSLAFLMGDLPGSPPGVGANFWGANF